MNKLEERFVETFHQMVENRLEAGIPTTEEDRAICAARIALELAEKSWFDGRDSIGRDGEQFGSFEDFKKEML